MKGEQNESDMQKAVSVLIQAGGGKGHSDSPRRPGSRLDAWLREAWEG